MNTETFEQITLKKTSWIHQIYKRRRKCNGSINTETDLPLSVDMPASVILEVTYAEPGIKGNTATNAISNC
jgi:elongation factor P